MFDIQRELKALRSFTLAGTRRTGNAGSINFGNNELRRKHGGNQGYRKKGWRVRSFPPQNFVLNKMYLFCFVKVSLK